MKLNDGTVILSGGQADKYVHITVETFEAPVFDTTKACSVGIQGKVSPLLALDDPGSGEIDDAGNVYAEGELNELGSVEAHSARFSELEESGLSESDLVFADPVVAEPGEDVVVPLGTPATIRIGQGLGSPSMDANGTLVRFKELVANSDEEGVIVRVNLRSSGWDMGDMDLTIAPGESGPGVTSFTRVWLGLLGVSTNEAGETTATIVVFEPSTK